MPKKVEHVGWPGAPDVWTPYTPAIKATGGTTVYFAGVTAAPVYHHHPHRPKEFDAMPEDMAGQARAAFGNLKKSLAAAGAAPADLVSVTYFLTDMDRLEEMAPAARECLGDARRATTTVQVVRLATDPRCLLEINAVAVVG